MASGILKRLVDNSKSAIAKGTYDTTVRLPGSDADLAGIIRAKTGPTLITEVKFSSPSLGNIRRQHDPVSVARDMISAGASALSVLTQPHLFDGAPEYLVRIRRSVDVPLLMKDIIIDAVQVDAGCSMGADYILLIQSVFDNGYADGLEDLISHTHKRGLGVLLEVHTEAEMQNALRTDADLVGINNRNLDTLQIDLATTANILDGLEVDVPVISESGISTAKDIRYLHDSGADAFLVGSSIMKSNNIYNQVKRLAGAY